MASKTLCATCGVSDPAMTAHCVLPVSLCEFKHHNGTNKQISGADAQDSKTTNRAILPNNRRKNVKTAIVAMILATAFASPSNAEPRCVQYSPSYDFSQSGPWDCDNSNINPQADAIAREAQRKNNATPPPAPVVRSSSSGGIFINNRPSPLPPRTCSTQSYGGRSDTTCY